MPKLSLISAYYENPAMLDMQMTHLRALPEDIRRDIEVIFVDDGSPVPAPEVDATGLRLRMFRIRRDIRWNQDGARNTGAHNAKGTWLFLIDIDHIVPAETLRAALSGKDPDLLYRFSRRGASEGPINPHPNSLLVTRDNYWRIGGYDEDYRGTYGTDILFNQRVRATIPEQLLEDEIIRYEAHDIADANTRRYKRNYNRMTRLRWKITRAQKRLGLKPAISILREPYDLVFTSADPFA